MHEDQIEEELAFLKGADFSRYLCLKMAPHSAHINLALLIQFYRELKQITLAVQEPALRAIRFQWWRESIEGHRVGRVTGSPLCDALSAPLNQYGDPLYLALGEIIDGFAAQGALGENSMSSEPQLYELLRQRYGGMLRAQLLLVEASPSDQVFDLINPAADAIGLGELISGQIGRPSETMCLFPQNLLQKYNLTPHGFWRDGEVGGFCGLFEDLAAPVIIERQDIIAALADAEGAVRGQLAHWYLGGLLYKKAFQARRQREVGIIELNPLMVYWHLMRFGR